VQSMPRLSGSPERRRQMAAGRGAVMRLVVRRNRCQREYLLCGIRIVSDLQRCGLLRFEAAGQPFDLVADRDTAGAHDLGRRRHFRIHLGL